MLTSVSRPDLHLRGRDLDRPGRLRTRSTASPRASRRTATPPATSTATATRPTPGACSTTRRPTTSGSTPTRTATFSDDEMMRPYKERFDVGHFGTDNPATAIAESMPFVVEYREDVDLKPAGINGTADFVNIGVVEAAHGTHVAGIAAGHSLFGGEMDGQAPGAKIVSAPGLLVGRRLHGRGPHRRHGRPRRQPGRRRRQHVDRRPARAQRRQQRPRPPLRHPHQRRGRPARHLGRQQRPRHQHDRRPVGRHRRRERGLLHHQGDLAVELRLRGHHPADSCTTTPRAVRARTAASSPT